MITIYGHGFNPDILVLLYINHIISLIYFFCEVIGLIKCPCYLYKGTFLV